MNLWDEKEAKRLFQELPFYNTFIEKPHIKRLKNIDLLHELPFYDGLSTTKYEKRFKRYARSYRIEIRLMAFTIIKKLIFNSSLNALVKNLSHNDFKYLSQEFTGEQLKLVKQKGGDPYEYMDSFKKFSDRNYLK